MTDKPTITVDLEILDGAVGMVAHSNSGKMREIIRHNIAARRRELSAPADGPWRFSDMNYQGERPLTLRDVDGEPLSERDMERAAMAPELADQLRRFARNSAVSLPNTEAILARFDSSGET